MVDGSVGQIFKDQMVTAVEASGSEDRKLHEFSIESMCFAILTLRRRASSGLEERIRTLRSLQNRNGSWPSFKGDGPEGSWSTALAILSLVSVGSTDACLKCAIHWLLSQKGRENNWLWRWKFQTVDTSVRFNPTKYGWSWIPGTTSWVIPTAFSILALQHAWSHHLNESDEAANRVETGTEMLFDRMCPGGGWNAGNGVAFGVPCAPYIDATAIALLALRGRENDPGTQASLTWLVNHLLSCPSPYSLAWGIIALAAYRQQDVADDLLNHAAARLTSLIEKKWPADVCTLAVCALALDAVDGDNVFEV